MRVSPTWLLLLPQVVGVLSTQDQKILADDGDTTDISMGPPPPPPRQPGKPRADLVDAALEALRKTPPPPPRRRNQQSGLVSNLVRFVSNALPSLEISGAPPAHKVRDSDASTTKPVLHGPLAEAVGLLEQSATQNNSDALYLLAEMNYYGNYTHPRDLAASFRHYKRLATGHGNATAQHMLGVFYGTGVGGVAPRDQARALLYHTFAAEQGDTRAQMTVAFRHYSGIGVPKDCEKSMAYYKRVADKAIAWYQSGPPLGMAWVSENYRIADEHGGVYGDGASASSAGMNANKASVNSDAHAAIDDVIEYLDLMSQKGDPKASYNLGRIYYEGQQGLERDLEQAKKYFFVVAKRYWKKDGRVLDNYKQGTEKPASRAAGFLGRMYLRGEGVEQNFSKAAMWFKRGMQHKDAQSQHGMGLMLSKGWGGTVDRSKAVELFREAADQDFSPAQVELGVIYLDSGGADDVRMANNYFELAARWGNIESLYYLAEMIYHGVGRDKTCSMAVAYYKNVAEKAEPLLSSWAQANQAHEDGDHETALVNYVLAAEQGYERAQNNVAYMLDSTQPITPVPVVSRLTGHAGKRQSGLLDDASLALVYWTRSSRQNNIDSTVKMGDYYFYGIGTEADLHKAVQCYTGASDYSQSAQALFNLGWMHENGVGLTQDYHLAKRYYDQALEVNGEAYLPATLALLKLRIRSAWNTFTHGPIHSIQDEPKPKKDWSLSEWINNFLEDDPQYYEDATYDDIFDDTIDAVGPQGEPMEDEGLTESLVIVGIAVLLVILLYYRQQRQQAHRREEEARRQQDERADRGGNAVPAAAPEQDRGLFPGDGEVEFGNWVAGGVGH